MMNTNVMEPITTEPILDEMQRQSLRFLVLKEDKGKLDTASWSERLLLVFVRNYAPELIAEFEN